MASLPYIISGKITDTDATNPNGAKVTIRNDRNGETTTTTTNSSGEYVVDAANFASGYLATDHLTVHCAWGLADAESSFDIADYGGGHTVNLTLTTVADSAETNYCTIQDVLDELGDKTTSNISYERVRKAILRAESEIEEQTKSAFRQVTVTDEIYDWNQYTAYKSAEQLRSITTLNRYDYWNVNYNDCLKLEKHPIISITSLYKNAAGETSADNWSEMTEQTGSGGEFITHLSPGIIHFIQNSPRFGKRSIKTTYIYGHTTVPKVVERLTILLAMKDVILSKSADAQFTSQKTRSVDGLTVTINAGASVAWLKMLNTEIDRCWSKVGSLTSSVV